MSKYNTLYKKVHTLAQLKSAVNVWRLLDKKVVFTNGCFDLIHLGHIDYLARAADLGDKLIVAVNSDDSTRRLKGPGRPVTDEGSRSAIMASLFFVDAVILFDQDTPLELITEIMPDVLVKGADYSPDQIVGAKEVIANGGQVHTIDYLPGYSTTLIEQKIRSGA